MIELDRHIEILLLSNDCVIVPGLGGFMAHHVEAKYDEEEQLFLPPLRTLGFNPQLTMNDSLLVQSYVEAYDMSYPEALRRIEDEVNELKQQIENKGSYDINGIGTLTLNENGKYIFTPCEAGILTPELYGLSSFEMARNCRQSPLVSEETEIEVEDEQEDDRAIIIKMSWVRNAVAVAAAVLAFVLTTTPVSNSETSNKSVSHLNNSILFGKMPKGSSLTEIDLTKEQTKLVAEKTDSLVPPKAIEAKKDTTETKQTAVSYCIVLASYVSKKNANAFVERLHKEGYAEAEVFIRNNVTRVVYGRFKTENAAYNKLRSIRGDKDFDEAWILKIKRGSGQEDHV